MRSTTKSSTVIFKYLTFQRQTGESVENLKRKILVEIDKTVIKEKKVGLTVADLEKTMGEKKRKIERALYELKGAQNLILSKFGKTGVYSPREMVDLYIKHRRKRGK